MLLLVAKNAMSGDGLQLDSGAVKWCDTIEYLGIHFRSGKRLQVDIDPIRRHFMLRVTPFMNALRQDQLIYLHLQECYCLSLLTYCHGALNLSKAQLSDLNVCCNNLYRKFFFIFIAGNLFVYLLMLWVSLIFSLNWSLLSFFQALKCFK